MKSRNLRRSSYPRRRRGRGLWWSFLGLAALGAAATMLAGRRRFQEGRGAPEGTPEPPPEPFEMTPPESSSLWIPGPQGNLFVRDGGEGGLPVVFLHSLGGNGGQWALQLDHLRRHRRAVALDLRGHGDSDPADDGDYSVEGLAADVEATVDQLALRRFLLVGHSLGGLVAIEYAGRHPDRAAGLLLVDPNGDQTRIPREQMAPFLEAVRKDPMGEMHSYFRQLVLNGDPDASRWVLEDLRLTDEDALVGAVEASVRYPPLPALDRYPGPKRSIISDMNNLPHSLHNLVPDLPVRLMLGTGHWLMMDRPEPFNHLLEEFVEEVERQVPPRPA